MHSSILLFQGQGQAPSSEWNMATNGLGLAARSLSPRSSDSFLSLTHNQLKGGFRNSSPFAVGASSMSPPRFRVSSQVGERLVDGKGSQRAGLCSAGFQTDF